jgi:hypothetical protein
VKPDPEKKSPPLRWPKFAFAAVILFFALAIFWVALAASKLRQQRESSNVPLPVSAPAR